MTKSFVSNNHNLFNSISLDYGSAASTAYPPFFDEPAADLWTNFDECKQERLRDFTGLDSLISPTVCLIVFVLVQFLERNGPIIQFNEGGLMAPYLKDSQKSIESAAADDIYKTDKFNDDEI